MGSYYDLKCLSCGYEFHAVYGQAGISWKESKVIKVIETGTRTDELAQVYKIMECPMLKVNSIPFFCKRCQNLFNYDVVCITGKNGIYKEKMAYCPVCAETTDRTVPEETFYKYGDKPHCPCPKCNRYGLTVTSSGIYD